MTEQFTLTDEDMNYALVCIGAIFNRLNDLSNDGEFDHEVDDMSLDLAHIALMLSLPLAFKQGLTTQTRLVFEKAINELERLGALSINIFKNEQTQAKYVKLMLDKSVKPTV